MEEGVICQLRLHATAALLGLATGPRRNILRLTAFKWAGGSMGHGWAEKLK